MLNSILETVGKTPTVRLNKLDTENTADIFCKLESFNPMGSIKDRIALAMIEDAEEEGELRPGMTVIEPTSGNTGIGLAMVCAVKEYRLVLTMPESMSVERRKLLKVLGAEIILTPSEEGMEGAITRAEEMLNADDDCYMPQQFNNPSNPEIHYRTTGKEILDELERIDAFVAGVGTGGTITGVGRALKEVYGDVEIIAVEPAGSPVLSGGQAGPHAIQGIGAGFIPGILDLGIIDHIVQVEEEGAVECTRKLAQEEGILAGISSGAALRAALDVAARLGSGKSVVVILPDSGERYLSTSLFSDRSD